MRSNQSKRNGSSSHSTVPLVDDNLAVRCAPLFLRAKAYCHSVCTKPPPGSGQRQAGQGAHVLGCAQGAGRAGWLCPAVAGQAGTIYRAAGSCWPCFGVQIFIIPVMRCQSCLVWNSAAQLDNPLLYPPWCLWKSTRKDLGYISISCWQQFQEPLFLPSLVTQTGHRIWFLILCQAVTPPLQQHLQDVI